MAGNMFLLLLAILWCATVAIMLIRAIRQYGYYQVIGPNDSHTPDDAPSIAVIVPARNEARNIGRCLEGLLGQQYPRERLSIIVVDDNSTDDTAKIVSEVVRSDKATLGVVGCASAHADAITLTPENHIEPF
jgi:chlorobactene glucosyltransferase